ncbi:MAG: hypothetical protein ACLFQR_01860, partial [Desulfovibrionales bacterium]
MHVRELSSCASLPQHENRRADIFRAHLPALTPSPPPEEKASGTRQAASGKREEMKKLKARNGW